MLNVMSPAVQVHFVCLSILSFLTDDQWKHINKIGGRSPEELYSIDCVSRYNRSEDVPPQVYFGTEPTSSRQFFIQYPPGYSSLIL